MKQGMHWIILWSLLTFVALVIFSYYDLEAAIYALPHKKSQFGDFIQYWGRKPLTVLIIAAGYLLADKKMRNKKKTLSRIASALCVHVVLHSALIVNLLKLFVGRPRPITLDSSGDGFLGRHGRIRACNRLRTLSYRHCFLCWIGYDICAFVFGYR